MNQVLDDDLLINKIRDEIKRVEDPEYPGLSIVDLGLLESIRLTPDGVTVGLVPTFSGCPALSMIAQDVRRAVAEVDGINGFGKVNGIEEVEVIWLRSPAWSTERLSPQAHQVLANDYNVSVQIGAKSPQCPRCGGDTAERSIFGSSRCRGVHVCTRCREPVEVLRS